MPDASLTASNGRAVLATVGTTVSLMGAATLAAIVVTGIVAFSSWPDGTIRQVPEPVRLADPAPQGQAGVALTASAVASAAPEVSAASVALPGDTPTPQLGRGVDGEAGTGNDPVAAAATPSPQSPPVAEPDRPRGTGGTGDQVADATVLAGQEVRKGIEGAATASMGATGDVLPRTSEVLELWARNAARSSSAATETVSEIVRILPQPKR